MGVTWTDEIDRLIAGDAAAMFAYLTPAKGVVMWPMAPLGLRDRDAGTVTVTTSRGLWKKLERVQADSGTAIAYHAREHGLASGPEFVLVQGRGRVQAEPDRAWLESITQDWERFLGPRERGWRGRLMDVYYWDRVAIEIDVERICVWPDAACSGEPSVLGAPWPDAPEPQRPPGNGTAPRVDVDTVVQGATRLPHSLLGWRGADGLPAMVAALPKASTSAGAQVEVAAAVLPPGARRAGFTSHRFAARMIGQEQRVYTGWLEVDDRGAAIYAPHTKAGSRLPASRTLFDVGAGVATRMGLREARRRGVI